MDGESELQNRIVTIGYGRVLIQQEASQKPHYVPVIAIWPLTESRFTVALPPLNVWVNCFWLVPPLHIGQTMYPFKTVAESLNEDEAGEVKETFALVAVRLYDPWLCSVENAAVTFPFVDINAVLKQ